MVIDISSTGALVEGTRLLPNTRAEIHIVTRHGRVLARTRVVRALVWRLEPDVVCYRTALCFDVPVDTEPNVPPDRPQSDNPAPSGPRESNGLALSERSESKGYSLPGEIAGNNARQGIPYPREEAQHPCLT